VPQLSPGDQDGVQELLDLRITGLGIGQDLADKINRALHRESVPCLSPLHNQSSADYLRGGRNVQQEWLLFDWWD
jgi:hypothetical protein